MIAPRAILATLAAMFAVLAGVWLTPRPDPASATPNQSPGTWYAEWGGFDNVADIVALSPTDIWAVGSHLIHFDGQAWTATEPWPDTASLTSLDIESGAGWAVGFSGQVMRFEGGQWSDAPRIEGASFEDVDIDASGSGWAVGAKAQATGGQRGAIWRIEGERWTLVDGIDAPRLKSVAIASENEAWAVGEKGTKLHFTGARWEAVASSLTHDLFSVYATAPDDVWAVGGKITIAPIGTPVQVILHYDGSQWQVSRLESNVSALRDIVARPDEAWAAGEDGVVMHFDGAQWAEVGRMRGGLYEQAMTIALIPNQTEVLVGGSGGKVALVGVESWQGLHGANEITGLTMTDPTSGWAVGPGGPAFRRIGERWERWSTPRQVTELSDVDGTDPNNVWGVTVSGNVLHWDGKGWTVFDPWGDNIPLKSVTVLPSGDAFAAGWRLNQDGRAITSVVLRFNPAAGDWETSLRLIGENEIIFDVDAAGADDAWASGNSVVHHFNGEAWERIDVGVDSNFYAIDVVSPTDIWLGGQSVILHFDGRSWSRSLDEDTLVSTQIHGIEMNPDGTGWAVGWHGVVLHYDGRRWQFIRKPQDILSTGHVPYVLKDFAVLGSGSATQLWAVGASESILRWEGDPAALPTITRTPTATPYRTQERPPLATRTPTADPTALPAYLPWANGGG